MTNTNDLLTQASDISLNDYCPLGLATCFIREEGETYQVKIIEPIPSAALEAILQGIPTSYESIAGYTLDRVVVEDRLQIPEEFPSEAQFCDRFMERAIAATRTFKARPEASKLIPKNAIERKINYSLDKKRILNDTKVVRAEDNVKQHQYTHQVL